VLVAGLALYVVATAMTMSLRSAGGTAAPHFEEEPSGSRSDTLEPVRSTASP